MGHVQNPSAIKIHLRSNSTQSNSRTAYRFRVRVRGYSDSKKNDMYKKIETIQNKLINKENTKLG